VNKNKSAIFYSGNCEQEGKDAIHSCLQIDLEALGERYLGMPTSVGKVSDGVFEYIPGRIRNFICGWSENLLSCAGREVLINSIAQAVPTYPMSCFKLPSPICKKMTTYISNYWWGSSIDNHKIHWLKWEKLTEPKLEGGMGFRDTVLFHQALLGKKGWRLLFRPQALCSRVLKGKYFPNTDFLVATRWKKSSETWRAILHGWEVLKKGLIKRIGPRSSVNIWQDKWIPGILGSQLRVRLPGVMASTVDDLFQGDTRSWDADLVRQSFINLDAKDIPKIQPSQTMDEDVVAWAHERSGIFSVRSAYRLLKEEQSRRAREEGSATSSDTGRWWKVLQSLKVPPKVRIFWWRVIQNLLPSNAELTRRHIRERGHCIACGNESESLYHVMVQCPGPRNSSQR
jgi:hypothetical protein